MELAGLALWWLCYLALALLGYPLAARLFGTERSAPFSLAVTLAAASLAWFWIGRLSFGPLAVVAGLALVLCCSLLLGRDPRTLPRRRFVEAHAVFTLAFALLVVLRATDPGIHPYGGERFLDYGLLQTLLRASALPPEDMWFAGEPLQYYYGGQLTAAGLAILTGTPARYAYNLAFAGIGATLVTTVYGAAAAIGESRGVSGRVAGVAGAFFVGFAANLFTAGRLALWALPVDADEIAGGIYDGIALTPSQFDYVPATRVVPGTLNQFPLYALVDGELHGHLLAAPFLALLVALCFEYYRCAGEGDVARGRLLLFGAIPAVGGYLAFTSSWSVPTVLGLAALTLTARPAFLRSVLPASSQAAVPAFRRSALPASNQPSWSEPSATDGAVRDLAAVAVTLLLVAAGIVAWSAPFTLRAVDGRGVAFVSDPSGFGALAVVHGAFLTLFAVYFGLLYRSGRIRNGRALVAVAGGLLGLYWATGIAAVLLVGPVGLVAVWALRTGRVGYEGIAILGGAGLVLLVEVVYVVDGTSQGRLNSVFKYYFHAWILWGIAGGAVVAVVLDRTGEWRTDLAVRGVVAALVVTTSLYGGLFVVDRAAETERLTLDGDAYAEEHHPDELEAARWLADRPGDARVVAAPGRTVYEWRNPVSSLTGVPTVVGWHHETLYRSESAYQDRASDVDAIYRQNGESAALLARYEVDYVYVGPGERQRYGEVDFRDVQGVRQVWRNDAVVVYRVDRE